MKIRNQSSLPSKYWLLIIAFFCVVLMGIEHATGGNGPLTFIANDQQPVFTWKRRLISN